MNPEAQFGSILFDGPPDRTEHDDPSMFSDLNLNQVFAAVAAGQDEYDLTPLFCIPLRDVRGVEYRHQVLRDLENKAVSDAVSEFADRLREMRKHLVQVNKLRARYQKERWFLDATGIYCHAVVTLSGALAEIGLGSRGLTAFRQYLAEYTGSPAFTGLVADIAQVTRLLDELQYCVNIKGNRVRVTKYEGEADYSAEVQETFAKFAESVAKDYRAGFPNWPEMNHVEERILNLAARLFPEAFQALDDFCARYDRYIDEKIRRFDREVQFYAAYLAFIAPMRAAGLEFCYPAMSAESKEIAVRDSFDLALAAKLMPRASAVVHNDFHLEGPERIFVVTEPNHGGKTTFARTFGQLHYLASLGYPIPAVEASLFLPDRVYTHFEREEDLATLHGKSRTSWSGSAPCSSRQPGTASWS